MTTLEVDQSEKDGAKQRRLSPTRAIGGALRRIFAPAGDFARLVALAVLWPLAHLPRSWALACADAVGWLFYISPVGARARRMGRAAFPDAGARSNVIARAWLTRPFRDFVMVTRIVSRFEQPRKWRIESRDPPSILTEPGASFIIVGGHFSRHAMTGLYMDTVIRKQMSTVIAYYERRTLAPRSLRLRMQLGEMMEGIRRVRDRIRVIEVGGPGPAVNIVRILKQPDNVVVLGSDSIATHGHEGGLDRPFAGHASANFALGTARIARLSQCPIVVYVPILDKDGGIDIEWSGPIMPPARDDQAGDERVTHEVLDILERAVGQRPGQYVLPFGEDRRWSDAEQRWLLRTPPAK